jgi:hypothetical protein
MIALVLGLLGAIGLGMATFVVYLLYVTPNPKDRIE